MCNEILRKSIKLFFIMFLSLQIHANETVTIVDKDGNVQICKVVPSGAIICL
jgi:hypothetical protein